MFDKQIEKKLQKAISNIDSSKIEGIKEKLNSSGDLSSMLGQLDIGKAQQKLSELNMGNIDLNVLLGELKSKPELLNELKKKL